MTNKTRTPIRLRNFDYSQGGAYFVTVCTAQRQVLFGEIQGGKMELNKYGEIIKQELLKTESIRPEMSLVEWVIMPNHIHFIVTINAVAAPKTVGAHGRAPLHRMPRSLGSFVAGFKSACTKRIHEIRPYKTPIWQRNYYDHVIRGEKSLNQTREYIQQNPLKWDEDENNPANDRIFLLENA